MSDFIIILEDEKRKVTIDLVEKDRHFKVDKNTFFKETKYDVWVPDEMIVHDGKMHTDDIMSAALVKYINPDVKIIRTRNIPDDFKGLVADVGRGRYDHHEGDKPRINSDTFEQYINKEGKPEFYAAFGLLCKDLLPGLVGKKAYTRLDSQIIRALDDADNNGTFTELTTMFELFNPAWDSDESEDDAFMDAVEIGIKFIDRMVKKERAKDEAFPYVLKAIKKMKNNILILDKRAPWQGLAKNSNAMLCVYPVSEGWAIQSVLSQKSDSRNKDLKMLLPEEWMTAKIDSLIFCHNNLFYAIFDTKENAIKYANIAIKNNDKIF